LLALESRIAAVAPEDRDVCDDQDDRQRDE
jgi:hypothetical protein